MASLTIGEARQAIKYGLVSPVVETAKARFARMARVAGSYAAYAGLVVMTTALGTQPDPEF